MTTEHTDPVANPPKNLYDVALQVTDEACGNGTYAELNANHPDPGVKAAIQRWKERTT